MFNKLRIYCTTHPLRILLLIYFLSRLPFLTRLPIFIDEATYLDWGWRTIHMSGLFYYPLVWAKMPLIIWFFGLAQSFTTDPLLAGRIVSLLIGSLSLVGLYRLSTLFFNYRTANIAGLLYLISPIFVFYDRQALMENSVAASGIWTCYFLTKFISEPKLKWSFFLALSLALGFMAKSNSLIFFPPTVLIVFYSAWKLPTIRIPLLQYFIFTLIFFLILASPILFNPLYWDRASDIFYFSLTPSEAAGLPLFFWLNNFLAHLEISFWHLTPPLLLAVILGRKNIPLLTLWLVFTIGLTSLVVRNPTTRYLSPYLLPTLMFAANWLSKKTKLISLFILPAVAVSLMLIIQPPTYFHTLSGVTSYSQIVDYLTGRDTGYQAISTIDYLQNNLPASTVFLGVAASAGNPEQAIFAYLRRRPKTITGYLDDHVLTEFENISCLTASIPVFFIARHDQQGGLEKFYTKVTTVTNSYNSDFNTIYTLKTPCVGDSFNLDHLISYYTTRI